MEIRNIGFSFGGKQVFLDFSLDIPDGKITCILGKSGIGKSTLLKLIARIHNLQFGSIAHVGKSVLDYKISYIFQEHRLLPWKTAIENIEYVLLNSMEKGERKQIAEKLLHQVGLAEDMHSFPHELSGGMKQRVSIARAFAVNPDILLLDEPLQGLDIATRLEIQNLFLALSEQYKPTVVYVTHDVEDALAVADKIIVFAYQPVYISLEETITVPVRERDDNLQIQRIRKQLYANLGSMEQYSMGKAIFV